ncbi:hypothetical protein CPL00363_CDS0144 [Klebsiella phage Torridgeon]
MYNSGDNLDNSVSHLLSEMRIILIRIQLIKRE